MRALLKFIDSHAHYDDPRFDGDRDELLRRLRDNGVERVINVGCTLERSKLSVELAEREAFIHAAVGIHPGDVNDTPDGYIEKIDGWLTHEKVVAVGEIGLDYHYDGVNPARQKRFFEEQLALAKERGMPVIIHSRDATEDTLKILKKYAGVSGVTHCFSGSPQTARVILELGLFISFTGVVTFKNARRALEALEVVPLDRLLLETDCPYMAPEPHRGKRCDSGMLPLIIEKIASVKGVTPDVVADQTSENARALFRM
jgi:TatD DNase family protein